MIKFPTKKRIDLYKNAVSPEQLQLDLEAAQKFMFDAWETDDLETVLKLIRKAIKKSPLCADAYSFYSEITEEPPSSKISNLETALYAASIALGADFQEFTGRFWGFVETRPYMRANVHGCLLRLAGIVLTEIPLDNVVVSGFTQRLSKRTGHLDEEYILSCQFTRSGMLGLNFSNIDQIDPIAALERFKLVRNMTATCIFHAIAPL